MAAPSTSEHVIMLDRYRAQFPMKWPITASGAHATLHGMTSYQGTPPTVVPRGKSEKPIELKMLTNSKTGHDESGFIYEIVH